MAANIPILARHSTMRLAPGHCPSPTSLPRNKRANSVRFSFENIKPQQTSLFRFGAADLLACCACCVCKSEKIEQVQSNAIRKKKDKTKTSVKLCLALADAAVAPSSGYSLRSKGFSAEAAAILPAALVQSSAPLPPDMLIVAWKEG